MNLTRTRKLARELLEIAGSLVPDTRQVQVAQTLLAYLRHRCYGLNDSLLLPYEDVVSHANLPDDLLAACTALHLDSCWNELQRLHGTFVDQDYTDVVEYLANEAAPARSYLTPESISKLVMALLEVKNGDRVIDIGSASGNFLTQVHRSYPRANCTGYECDNILSMLFKVRIALLTEDGENITSQVVIGDAFETAVSDPLYNDQELRKIVFVDVPLGLRYRDLSASAQKYAELMLARLHCSSRLYSTEWLFLGLASRATGYKGRGACLMPTSCCFKANDLAIRKTFVDSGYIDCVIELPTLIVPKCSVAMALVLFGRGKKGVNLIDARSYARPSRQSTSFTIDDIHGIVSKYKEGGIYISSKDLEQADYNLLASRYSKARTQSCETRTTPVSNEVPLSSFCRISRGTTVSFKQVENLITDKKTQVRYLLPNDLINGAIADTTPYLDISNIEGKVHVNGHAITTKLYCVKGNTILMTRNSYPPRIAVVNETPAEDVIVNGNIFMLSVDPAMADVTYVRIFLESERGLSMLKGTYVEALTPGIDQKALQAIMVPLPDLSMQRALVSRYEAAKVKIDELKQKVAAAQAELSAMVNQSF